MPLYLSTQRVQQFGTHLCPRLPASVCECVAETGLCRFFTPLDSFFANIDYDLHLKQEKYYQTIFYLICLMMDMQVSAGVKTGQGRIVMWLS